MGQQRWRSRLGKADRAHSILEFLESRQLLSTSVAPAVTPTVSPGNGLVPIRWHGEHTFAASGQWIAILDRPATGARKQLTRINAVLAGTGFRATRRLNSSNIFLIQGDHAPIDQVRAALETVGGFKSVEPDTIRTVQAAPQTKPNDPAFNQQWGLDQANDVDMDAPEAWSLSTGSRSVITAIVDSGVDYTHSDLAANIWTNPGEIAGNGIDDDGNGFIDDIHGFDFANYDGDPMDDNGHGTGVAGTIAAVGNNNFGTTGVAWQTTIMPIKFISANGSGYTSAAVASVNYIDMMRRRGVNVRVVNNSWIGNYSVALSLAVDSLNSEDVLFVAAAGNGGIDYVGDNDDVIPTWPASMTQTNVISVAATDGNDLLAGFSNFGAVSVDLAAPGVGILTTGLHDTFGWGTGTSDSAPMVSGVAALAWSYAPTATAAQVKAAILDGTDRIPALAGKCVSGGRLNAYNTLNLLNPPPTGSGLTMTVFDNKDLTGTSVDGPLGAINNNWKTNSPSSLISPDTWSARWTGQIQPQYSETYTFFTLADDGVRVWVNGQQIINRWSRIPPIGDLSGDGIVNAMDFGRLSTFYASGGPAVLPYDLNNDGVIDSIDFTILSSHFGQTVNPIENTGTFTMTAGQKYDIAVEYYDNYGVASMKLSWSSPSTPKQVVPGSRLYPSATPSSAAESVAAATSASLFSDKPVIPQDPIIA